MTEVVPEIREKPSLWEGHVFSCSFIALVSGKQGSREADRKQAAGRSLVRCVRMLMRLASDSGTA